MKAFPHVNDLVTDVSWNYRVKMKIAPFKPRKPDAADGSWRVQQADVDRPQEFRKCIECFLCQDVCHVLRDHDLHEEFIGPRFLIYTAQLEMNPIDSGDRRKALKEDLGIGYCNITKCCTKVCPEEIKITDNAIIPLKERVVDVFFDPIARLVRQREVAASISRQLRVGAFAPACRIVLIYTEGARCLVTQKDRKSRCSTAPSASNWRSTPNASG